MSVRIDLPAAGAVLTAADGELVSGALRLTVTGHGPRRAAVFVNEAVAETDEEGRFTCEVLLAPGEAELAAGLLTGCPCITQRVTVTVRISSGRTAVRPPGNRP